MVRHRADALCSCYLYATAKQKEKAVDKGLIVSHCSDPFLRQ